MAAIEGIASVSNTSAASYQTKQAPQVNSVEAVADSSSQGAGAALASQVVTVKEKNASGNNGDGQNKSKQESGEATTEQIKKAVEELNKKMTNTACEYGFHDKTNRVTIKIVDKVTKDVIKEYPAEETLDMIAKAWELAGLMVDKRL